MQGMWALSCELRLRLAIEGDVGKAAVWAGLADDSDRGAAQAEGDAGVVEVFTVVGVEDAALDGAGALCVRMARKEE